MLSLLASSLTLLRSVAGDPASTRTVYTIVIALAAIGVGFIALGIWLIRQTKIDPVLLAPLERMTDRRWRRSDPTGRQRLLDDVRPEGAEPVHRTPTEPEIDSEFDTEPRVPSFDDLDPILVDVDVDVDAVLPDRPAPATEAAAADGERESEDGSDGPAPADDEPAVDDGEPVGDEDELGRDEEETGRDVYAGEPGGEPAGSDRDR